MQHPPPPRNAAKGIAIVYPCPLSPIASAYLQLGHGADELIWHLHVGAAGIVEGDQLGGQVLVAVEEPGAGMETPGGVGR